jgi:hypothetical protein
LKRKNKIFSCEEYHFVKLPAHRAGLPGNEISFFIVPLDPLGLSTPPTRRGLRGTCRSIIKGLLKIFPLPTIFPEKVRKAQSPDREFCLQTPSFSHILGKSKAIKRS